MRQFLLALVLGGAACTPAARVPSHADYDRSGDYFPPPDAWASTSPRVVGVDSAKLDAAVAFARAHEIAWLHDMNAQVRKNIATEPCSTLVGPTRDRADQNGVIIRHGYVIAQWGDVNRVDMTFSVAKSYLSTVAGLAFDRGLIASVDDSVVKQVHDGGYDTPHDSAITWRETFEQTSEWEGTLWGQRDWCDRRMGHDRVLQPPGTFWEYNDIRVNRAAYSVLQVWQRPLPDVLRDEVMTPIGAHHWEWHGYRTSWTMLNGQRVQSVSGGGHYGGGLWASTWDHARFGYLMLHRGVWNGHRLLSERWIDLALAPTPIKPTYGFMWWLNTDQKLYPAATPRSFFALGAGGNTIWVDPEDDMVVVVRWLDPKDQNAFMALVKQAIAR